MSKIELSSQDFCVTASWTIMRQSSDAFVDIFLIYL